MSDTAITVDGLSKLYHIGPRREKYQTARQALTNALSAPFAAAGRLMGGFRRPRSQADKALWALKDISLDIRRGEVVGVIGRNGAGKSTLLKIISRITEPTHGWVRLRGRVGSLLEVGTGFHPELTGRENIYLNGAILGMRRAEINRKFDEIVAFAETEKFLDTPVKHYSSGMHVRLAFAVAAHLEPEILLVDEVLAVGDAAFQKKCLGKLGGVAQSGRTVMFVSHNMAAISALCTRAFLLADGQLAYTGSVNDAISQYLDVARQTTTVPLADRTDRQGDGRVRFTAVTFFDEKGNEASQAVAGKALTIQLHYVTADGQPARNVDMDVAFYGPLGQLLFFCKAQLAHGNFDVLPPRGAVCVHIPKFPLSPGHYHYKLWCQSNRVTSDRLEEAGTLAVEAGDFYGTGYLPTKNPDGIVMVEHSWKLGEA